MTRQPQVGWLKDGKRLHLQDGPIDLIVEAQGHRDNLRAAYQAAIGRFTGLLDEGLMCREILVGEASRERHRPRLGNRPGSRAHHRAKALRTEL